MLIIARNAERELNRQLQKGRKDAPFMRCLHFRFSELEAENREWIPAFLSAFEGFIDERDFTVFLCTDGDVVILTKTLTARRLEQFLTHLTPKLVPAPIQELAQLFEVSEDWQIIDGMMNEKLTTARTSSPEEKENTEITYAENIQKKPPEKPYTPDSILTKAINTLKTRRNARPQIQILLIEDDAFSQRLLKNLLAPTCEIACISNGNNAVEHYVQYAPDIVFLDIGLPDISGLEVLKRLFMVDEDAYIVMFSAQGHKQNIMAALENGAIGFVGKPFSKEKLEQYIERCPHILTGFKRKVKSYGHSAY